LVDPTDHERWSDAVARVLQDKDLRSTLTARGKKRAADLCPGEFARELLNLFDGFALYQRTWPSSEDSVPYE